ncbi:MAG: hypothetical protein RMJ33_06245 [Saprospiraceae bacterium]|nr:hypothetical protein [Saprospiraceae bacterium]MDW8229420.1 hypothetical protein [Saprospiraceae bacterium]
MKNISFVLAFLSIIKLSAQQNLFNIPSGDVTEKNKVFYQHQVNLYASKLESKGHFVYGLGRGWDAGVNLVGKGVYFTPEWRLFYNDNPDMGALYPYIMPTLQKKVILGGRFDLNLGAQAGVNVSHKIMNKELAFFNYALGVFYFMERKSRLVGGLYHTNRMFVGTGNHLGVLLGYEVKVGKRFYLMGDWISGNNDSSVAVLGGMYNLTRRMQLCAGLLVPNPENPKPFGIVLEVNLLGWDLDLGEEEPH